VEWLQIKLPEAFIKKGFSGSYVVSYNGGDPPYTRYPTLDFKPLEAYPDLSSIEIIFAGLKEIQHSESLENCNAIEVFSLSGNELQAFETRVLRKCTPLHTLTLRVNLLPEVDLTWAKGWPNITRIDIRSNRLTSVDLTPLRHCQNLKSLYMGQNPLEKVDLTPVLECPKIQHIDIGQVGAIPNPHPLLLTLQTSYIKQVILPAPKDNYATNLEVWTSKKSFVEYDKDFYTKDETWREEYTIFRPKT